MSCQHVINQDCDPLQGHTYGNFCVPSIPHESWAQLGSANSTSLLNHKGRFLLEPKQEKGGNVSASGFALGLTCLPPLVLTPWRGTRVHMFYHLLPIAPSTSHNAPAFFFLFSIGWGHSPMYFFLCEMASVLLFFLRLKMLNRNQEK